MRAIASLLQMALPQSGLLGDDYGQGAYPQGMLAQGQAPQQDPPLLSPEEMKRARPGLMDRLASMSPRAPSPRDMYASNIDRILKMKEMTAGLAKQRKLEASRQAIAQAFPAAPNETSEQAVDRMKRMFAAYSSAGDTEMMTKLGETLKSIGQPRSESAGTPQKFVDEQGRIVWVRPGEPVSEGLTPWTAPEREDRTLVPVQDPETGETTFMRRSDAEGKSPRIVARIESAMNTAAKARLKAAIGEMNNAHDGMLEFERGLQNGTVSINGLQQFAGRVANSFTHDDPVSMMMQSTALSALNKINPDLGRYIRRALSFAEGESMISQRPSDFRTKMAAFLSAAASGASPEMIADIVGRRKALLDPLNEVSAEEPTKPRAKITLKKLPAGDLEKATAAGKRAEFLAWAKTNGYEVP